MPERAAGTFRVLDAADAADAARWRAAWTAWPAREVFAHPAYVALGALDGARARAALFETDGATILYPFLHRPLPAGLGSGSDVSTPYGYGGAVGWGRAVAEAAPPFWTAFDAWAAAEGVVAEFVRFYLDADLLLPYPGEIVERQPNIVMPLDGPPDALWNSAERKVRKNVRQAQRSGVSVVFDATGDDLDTFLHIYRATMARREAGAAYDFPNGYFAAIHRGLPGQFVYAYALHNGRAVAAELALISAEAMYSFLGGTLQDAFALRPNDLLKTEMAAWGRAAGLRRFVLGGGVHAGDGIYRYKQSFAPNGSVPFRTGSRVLDPAAYGALVARRRAAEGPDWNPDPGFFPQYRT